MRNVFLPRTFEDLWETLEKEPDAALYAGGTDLLVKIRAGCVDPPCLVCLERLHALQGIREEPDKVFIGAATTHSRLVEHPAIREQFPVLVRGASVLGSPPIRHMGTIGGNIVTASPAGDTLPALYGMDAAVEVRSAAGTRILPIREFILGPGTVDLRKGEILCGVWLNKNLEWNVHHYEKVGRRKAQACSVASLAAVLVVSETFETEKARLAWGSVGPTVVTLQEVEDAIVGKQLSNETLNAASTLVQHGVSPIDDIRASAEYRRYVAGALLTRLADYAAAPIVSMNGSRL